MQVVIEFTESGVYKDRCWESSFKASKGQLHRVSPQYAAQLIKHSKAIFRAIPDTHTE
ncbi:C factor cell-cell signaling protein [Photobacterium galatheae]|uniref:C factor cell-cell signaling protein n=1 Tax=Photobacterium galatheae TaxID=1654360 RepID=A0A066RNP8_9GAMM|nr:C factor cell-cell signaling protein [Photobacterium galatheae]